jgi:hypothetical protein
MATNASHDPSNKLYALSFKLKFFPPTFIREGRGCRGKFFFCLVLAGRLQGGRDGGEVLFVSVSQKLFLTKSQKGGLMSPSTYLGI